MITIKVGGTPLYIPKDTTLVLEQHNNSFDIDNITSDVIWTFDLPAKPNARALNQAHYINISNHKRYRCEISFAGVVVSNGYLFVQSVVDEKTISCGVVLDGLGEEFGNRKLKENDYGDDVVISQPTDSLEQHRTNWYNFLTGSLNANSIYKFYYTVDSFYSYTDTNFQSAAAAGTACMVQGRRAYTEGNYTSTIPVANYVADIEDKHYIVTNIAPSFCRYTDNITAINGGKGLKVIGDSAFKGCKQLKSFSLPNLREIGAAAFRDCIRLSSITLGNKLETLGLSAFYGCTSLTGEIVIPSSIKMIRSYCFAHCSNLNSLFLESVSSATIYKRFFQYNASGFKCYVNLNDYYRLYGLADWSDDNGTAMSRLVPFYKAIYEWSAISSFASMKLPTDATFYTIPSYDAATHTAKTQVITGTVKGKTGLLVHATPGKMYRFDLPTGTIVTPTNLLKGAGQDNLLITPPSNSSYYYFKSSEKKFVHFTNDRTFQAYHCYLDIPLATAPATDIIKVDIIPYTNFIKGDVNGDGRVNVSDVTELINMILGVTTMNKTRADVNGDGQVNVSDVTALINIILGVG